MVEVLAPQGHMMLVTSRPAGLQEDLFTRHFHRLKLGPLSEAQQQSVIEGRVGKGDRAMSDALVGYLRDKVPLDEQTGERVTGNPLMLSVTIRLSS